jgi:hypothetical protein
MGRTENDPTDNSSVVPYSFIAVILPNGCIAAMKYIHTGIQIDGKGL